LFADSSLAQLCDSGDLKSHRLAGIGRLAGLGPGLAPFPLELTRFRGHFILINKESEMSKPKNPKPPYPVAFRQQMVDLVTTGRRRSELAKEFGCHQTSILSWVRIARAATPSLSNLPPTLH
jgi:hypothetical protein